ncbi:hypothetical protein HNR60_004106 [Rhodopseudomonas rhenobacensis]|uniref:Uncharacterized protein n=1 Tax=Rhodopseudomonas rhenobacensis TaxID=87461 RepID=A0A7W7Z786_9BRAD|nr:hypothetical protein [Rhodopseudomonas rhenobacensis]MBB5049330.1 hypothetical protein [Rhodopseudomonas rhenobacensis]
MAESAEIERIARDVVNAHTVMNAVTSVISRPSVDWTDDPIIEINVVVRPEAETALLKGETPLNILTRISDQLIGLGEHRFPIIHYATTADMEAVNDASEP